MAIKTMIFGFIFGVITEAVAVMVVYVIQAERRGNHGRR